jgi:murein L,D-transpeptidase YafK
MQLLIILFTLFFPGSGISMPHFSNEPMSYTRVRQAYNAKEKIVNKTLEEHFICRDEMRIFIRAFKTEKILEVWAKNSSDSTFVLLKELPICEISGNVGPKRRSGDLQAPEGFYHISDLNPYSKYYLSMEINYPNDSDRIRGVRGHLGNEIYIHGDCLSSGCLAMTDERIKELFIYCIEAYKGGQKKINIAIYPAKLSDKKYTELTKQYAKNKDKISLWADLKKSYDLFDSTKVEPNVVFLPDGTHQVN